MEIQLQEHRDTIPRIQRIVPHLRDQLPKLRKGMTFEHARLCYAQTVDLLFERGLGRRTAGRVGNQYEFWSSTRDLLKEAMRLGFVERQRLPSSRRHVDDHRERQYKLTQFGHQVADEAESNFSDFCDRLADAIYDNHFYFRAFIDKLQDGPIGCPEISEYEVEQARMSRLDTDHWVKLAADRISHLTSETIDMKELRETIISFVRNRFGQAPDQAPTSKQLAQALNDAYIDAVLNINGLAFGATDLKIMKAWGSQLLLLDQSRYVPAYPGQNVIWLAAEVSKNGGNVLQRKTLANRKQSLTNAVIAAYTEQANAENSSLSAPYLPIYRVRAQAAFNCQVTRALIDIVIEQLVKSSNSESGVQVWLHLGTTRQPYSEPVYRRGGNPRYEITMQPRSGGDQYAA